MDGHLKNIREESVDLCTLPDVDPSTREMLTQSIEGVKQGATSLTELYQRLMTLCQQKRDLYIVAVKFHMTVRQVRYDSTWYYSHAIIITCRHCLLLCTGRVRRERMYCNNCYTAACYVHT